ncbi:hypothetical protein [Leptospira alexanderi]|nr:hypothetical protein [Leptospira alexanderi]
MIPNFLTCGVGDEFLQSTSLNFLTVFIVGTLHILFTKKHFENAGNPILQSTRDMVKTQWLLSPMMGPGKIAFSELEKTIRAADLDPTIKTRADGRKSFAMKLRTCLQERISRSSHKLRYLLSLIPKFFLRTRIFSLHSPLTLKAVDKY